MIWIVWKKCQILFWDCVQSELFSYFLQSFLKWVSSSVPRIRVNQVTGFQADLLDPVFLTATLWMKRNVWSSPTFFFLCSQKTGTGNLTSVTESVTAQFFTLPSSVPWPLDNMRNGWMEFGNTRQRKILLFRKPLQYRTQRDLALTLKLTIARRL